MGQSPQFYAYILLEVQHIQQNAPKRGVFGKYFLNLVDNAPNRGYNEVTIKQGTKQITRNGAGGIQMYKIKWTIKHSGENGYYTTDRGLKLYKTEKAAQAAANKFQKAIGTVIQYEVEEA